MESRLALALVLASLLCSSHASCVGTNIQLKFSGSTSQLYCTYSFNGTLDSKISAKMHSVNNDKFSFRAWVTPTYDAASTWAYEGKKVTNNLVSLPTVL